ncbi:thiol reductant ABC exporter subunit CydC [Devosia sp. XJ19-1]|uniref:Thiol reductant ABC exporter subunit CydC n=1 Tax=Devosia ureilytica TaxID=2952754 RepID=A0A9Q4AQQ5_9HYPH|nr:thiol reductant ABC exporter subunit CydC [Devosia ureilytica]MCP8884334.1 thiol reductant ABC exporter subunit CydC [Devosia ureilytica]MCP8887942.1 thiol reductant ABC exporter subunit CydC [Devosia ureilytica]
MKALLTFLPLFRQRSGALLLALTLSLITLVAGVFLLGTSGWFITATALTTAGLGFNLFVPSAMVRGLSFVRILARYGERLVGHNATLKLLSDLRGWLFARLFPRFPLPDRSLRHGDLVSRLTADVDALDTAFLVAIGPLVSAIVVGGAMTAILTWLLPAAALPYGLALAAAALGVPATMVLVTRQAGRDSVAAQAELRMGVLDGVHGHGDLVLLGALGTAAQAFSETSSEARRLRLRLGAVTSLGNLAVQALAALALVGTLWAGLSGLDAGMVDGPVMAGLLLAVLGSFEITGLIVRSTSKATQAMAAAERLVALAEQPMPVDEPGHPLPIPVQGTIALDRISFAYPGLPAVLHDLSLTVAPGERIAITGPSGSGKSTLLRLLLRLADPQAGSITIGGTALPQLGSTTIHAHMALLSQDSPVFIDTIRNNLLIGRAEASDADLWAALAQAQLDEHVRALPKGLDTILGESGRTLSAGQARRLCLARALLSNAPVLLLDEPTNALDRDTEEAFFKVLATATQGRTVIMVTHAAIPEGTVDRVLTMENGVLG